MEQIQRIIFRLYPADQIKQFEQFTFVCTSTGMLKANVVSRKDKVDFARASSGLHL